MKTETLLIVAVVVGVGLYLYSKKKNAPAASGTGPSNTQNPSGDVWDNLANQVGPALGGIVGNEVNDLLDNI